MSLIHHLNEDSQAISNLFPEECGGAGVENLTRDQELWVCASLEALHCVLKQETLSST